MSNNNINIIEVSTFKLQETINGGVWCALYEVCGFYDVGYGIMINYINFDNATNGQYL